jgi:hypothetical protein
MFIFELVNSILLIFSVLVIFAIIMIYLNIRKLLDKLNYKYKDAIASDMVVENKYKSI